MCGILGSVNLSFDSSVLDEIKHRGPDYGKIENFTINQNQILFGHRRLSILDLTENGNQPMQTPDGDFVVIFNGEIYNYTDLKSELKEIDFKSHSDTEVLLHYIAQKGIDSIRDFNGVFAFGLLDKTNEKLYLARDPYGVKPLYFYKKEDQFVFSSEIRPIQKLIQTSLDKDSLAELLKLRYNPAEDTLYTEIKKILPGHFLIYDLKTHQTEVKTFFKPKVQKRQLTMNQAVEQYGDLFEKAVKRQLMSDVELGVLLSGGIDSALVSYFAVKNSETKIKSFTVGFEDDDDSNELGDALESASILGTEHHEVMINEEQFLNSFEEVIKIVEEPLGTTSSIPMFFLNQEVSKFVKVVLTGQGADEPLGGYTRYKAELYRKNIPAFLVNLAKPLSSLIRDEKLRRFLLSAGETDIIKRFEKTYMLFQDSEIERFIGQKDDRSYRKIKYFYELNQGHKRPAVEAMMAIDLQLNLADDLLLYTDKVSMNFSVETRVPILDLELVEFIESLPTEYKLNKNQRKIIHREFAKSVLPDSIVNRTKKGFRSPTNKWFNQELGSWFKNIVNDDANGFNRIFNKDEILKLLKLHQSGYNMEKQLFLLLSIYFWFKNNNL